MRGDGDDVLVPEELRVIVAEPVDEADALGDLDPEEVRVSRIVTLEELEGFGEAVDEELDEELRVVNTLRVVNALRENVICADVVCCKVESEDVVC